MRAARVTFYVIILMGVFATGSSDNLLTEENNLEYSCPHNDLSIKFVGSAIKILSENFIISPIITCLDLENNQIEMVEKDAFRGLPHLRYLNVAGNKIVNLTSFGGYENLETLILANQSYEQDYPFFRTNKYGEDHYDEYGRYIHHYTEYTVKHNALTIIGRYPQLRYLDISNNSLHSVDWLMGEDSDYNDLSQQFPKLTYLDLSNNVIERLFSKDFSSSSLSLMYLYLRNNNMVFANLKYFKDIVILIADNNNFKHLNKKYCSEYSLCVSDMPQLKNLSLSNNTLMRIDYDFFESMPQLTMLNLSSNQLNNTINGVFDDLNLLTNLELSNNLLTNLSIFNKPSRLSSLSVNSNNIEYVHAEDFVNMTNLRKLSMNNNHIRNIDDNAFWLLNSLEELHLANNFLTNLPVEWSNNLDSLLYLDVANNRFKYLESLSLRNSPSLIRIDLIGNNIIHFSSKILSDISQNLTIYLANDPKEIELRTSG